MKSTPWLSGMMAAGILLALPAGLKAEEGDETRPDRREKYQQRYEENGWENFGEADTNGDRKISLQEAKDYGVGRAENGKIGKKRFGMADADGDGNLTPEEVAAQLKREEAEYHRRVNHFCENHPRLRERWEGMSEDERAHLRRRIHAKLQECRDHPERREALRERLRERFQNASPEDKRKFLQNHPGIGDRRDRIDERHDGGRRDRIEDKRKDHPKPPHRP